MIDRSSDTALERFRPWFYAAAAYNLIWGTVNVIFPRLVFDLIGMSPPAHRALWQVVGMFVLVYAPGYWWAARHPGQHRHIILIGFIGKIMGPVGFLWAAVTKQLPLSFGWVILTNDLIWWPAFGAYLREAARLYGGFKSLLLGE